MSRYSQQRRESATSPDGPVVIVGMHRSGTSMIARALMLCGLHLGDDNELLRAAPDNPEGFWEHTGVKRVNEAALAQLGAAWDLPPKPTEGWASSPDFDELRSRAREVVESLRHDRPWGWKDPRTVLTLDLWETVIPNIRMVVCVRNPVEVALSLRSRNSTSLSFGLELWCEYNQRLIDLSRRGPMTFVHYDRFLAAPAVELTRLSEFADLACSPDEVNSVVDVARRDLRHADVSDEDLPKLDLSPTVLGLYAQLCRAAGQPVITDPPGHAHTSPVGRVNVDRVDLAVAARQLNRQRGEINLLRARLLDTDVAAVREANDPVAILARTTKGLAGIQEEMAALRASVEDLRAHLDLITDGTVEHDYASVIMAARRLAREALPADADVAVISHGDARLLDLPGRRTRHFPASLDGSWLGFHPASDVAAIAQLEAARARGADHLLVPAHAIWWFDHYRELARHLDRYRLVHRGDDGVVFELVSQDGAQPAQPFAVEIDALAHRHQRRLSVICWGFDGDALRLPHDADLVAVEIAGGCLPHLDRSVDVVALRATTPDRTDEARRVATIAVVHVHPDGSAVTVWEAPTPPPPSVTVVTAGDGLNGVTEVARAVSAATTDVVVIAGADMIALPGCIDALTSAIEAWPAAAATPLALRSDGSVDNAGRVIDAQGQIVSIARGTHDVTSLDLSRRSAVDCVSSSYAALRRDAIEFAGGLDPASPRLDLALADLCLRLKAAGSCVVYEPSAIVVDLSASDGTTVVSDSWQVPVRGLVHQGRRWIDAEH